MLKEDISSKRNQHTYKTYLFLEGNQNINVNQNEVISILSNFVENEGNLIDKKKKRTLDMINTHLKSNESKKMKYEDPEW